MGRIDFVVTLTEEEWNTIHTALMNEFTKVQTPEALKLLQDALRATYKFNVKIVR